MDDVVIVVEKKLLLGSLALKRKTICRQTAMYAGVAKLSAAPVLQKLQQHNSKPSATRICLACNQVPFRGINV